MEEGRKEEEKEKENIRGYKAFFQHGKGEDGVTDVQLLFLSRVGLREIGSLQGKKVGKKCISGASTVQKSHEVFGRMGIFDPPVIPMLQVRRLKMKEVHCTLRSVNRQTCVWPESGRLH